MAKKHDVTPVIQNAAHPGEILTEEFLKPMSLSQSEFARRTGIPQTVVNEICRGKRGISPRMALIVATDLKTSPELWMNMQMAFDLWQAWVKLSGYKQALPYNRTPLIARTKMLKKAGPASRVNVKAADGKGDSKRAATKRRVTARKSSPGRRDAC